MLVPWDAERETWDSESERRMQRLMSLFETADKDGNGVIDRDELRSLLERVGDGDDEVPVAWLTDDDISEVLEQYDTNGDGVICFDEFVSMAQDKIFLEGKLQEYRDAFRAVDAGGNGSISATELYQLFQKLGHPITYDKLVKVMEQYDVDQSGVIDFGEFLRMFRGELLDLNDIVSYIKSLTASHAASAAAKGQAIPVDQLAAKAAAVHDAMSTSPSPEGLESGVATAPAEEEVAGTAGNGKSTGVKLLTGAVNLFFSEEDFDKVLAANPGKLIVLMGSVTWCRPCKAFQDKYEKTALHYQDCIFLKFYGNSNEGTKALFKDRLKSRTTPSFFIFKDGNILSSWTGANAKRLETNLREAYGEQLVPQDPLWLDLPGSSADEAA